MNCALVVLAGGQSSRLGQPKQLVSFSGKTLLRRSLETALSVSISNYNTQVGVVLGAKYEECLPETKGLNLTVLSNADWPEGMASSVRIATQWALDQGAEILLILLCDQPFVTSELVQNLLLTQQESGNPIVACEYKPGTVGVPMAFSAAAFNDLLALKGDRGAKAILRDYEGEVSLISFPEGSFDIDTPADVERLLKTLSP